MKDSEDLDIYAETRQVGELTFDLHGGKATLTCSVTERWVELLARTIKCGASWKRTIRSRLGVSKTDQTELESSIKGGLGIPNVASLEAMIQGKVTGEVRLETSRDWEEEYQFESPECGRRVIKLYQQQRIFDFSYQDTRPFRRDAWQKPIVSWLDRIHDGSRIVKFDPECGCEQGPSTEAPSAGRFLLNIGKMSFLMEPEINDSKAYLYPLHASVPAEILNIQTAERSRIRIERRMVPQHLLFLSGDESTEWVGEIFRVGAAEEDRASIRESVLEARF